MMIVKTHTKKATSYAAMEPDCISGVTPCVADKGDTICTDTFCPFKRSGQEVTKNVGQY